jgi:hypothetical protein
MTHFTNDPDPLGHTEDGVTEIDGLIASLGDDAAQIRTELANCRPNGEGFICEEWADSMEAAASRLDALQAVLIEARDFVEAMRTEVINGHTNPRTGLPEPLDVAAPENALLARIDAALSGSTAASGVAVPASDLEEAVREWNNSLPARTLGEVHIHTLLNRLSALGVQQPDGAKHG